MSRQKTALVLGAGGFIGSHMVNRLKAEGYWVRGVDLKYPEFSKSQADQFIIGDLRGRGFVSRVMLCDGIKDAYQKSIYDKQNSFDEVYQFAADMGGAGFVFTKDHDADIMYNSAMINLNVAYWAAQASVKKLFYSSSACIYPQEIQNQNRNNRLKESDAYPANPDSCYGWEKLFSEQLYTSFKNNKNLQIRIARFHNIYGPEGTYEGGREKAPAAICRKVAEARDGDTIDIWGDGEQTRSFLYIDECIEGVWRLMQSDYTKPLNIGSDMGVSINSLVKMVLEISGKHTIFVKHVPGPVGVRGRNSDNKRCKDFLDWAPSNDLKYGMQKLYNWVKDQIAAKKQVA